MDWLGLDARLAHLEVPALVGEGRLVPQAADDLYCLAKCADLLAGGALGQAEGRELLVVATDTEAEYHSVLVAFDELGVKPGVGSARSIPGFNLYEALACCGHHLLSHGGHAAAGGSFTILRFAEADVPDVVYIEQLTSALYLDKREDVDHYLEVMNVLSTEALTPAESVVEEIKTAGGKYVVCGSSDDATALTSSDAGSNGPGWRSRVNRAA